MLEIRLMNMNAICRLISKLDMGKEKITKPEDVSIEMPPNKCKEKKE